MRACSVCSITARASSTGFLACLHAATAPARPAPVMTDASSSACPVAVSAAPRPALNSGSFSRTSTLAQTASSALPPAASTCHPAEKAARRTSSYGARPSRVSSSPPPPAPASASAALPGEVGDGHERLVAAQQVVAGDPGRALAGPLGVTRPGGDVRHVTGLELHVPP